MISFEALYAPSQVKRWGLLASGPDVRGVQVFDLDATRIPERLCRALVVPSPW